MADHHQENLNEIRTRVDNIERMVRLDIAANPNSRAYVADHLKAKKGAAKIYLALESGPKSQDELIELSGMSQANVSKICTFLYERGLIWKVPSPTKDSRVKYSWSELERTLGISKIAKRLTRS